MDTSQAQQPIKPQTEIVKKLQHIKITLIISTVFGLAMYILPFIALLLIALSGGVLMGVGLVIAAALLYLTPIWVFLEIVSIIQFFRLFKYNKTLPIPAKL